MKYEVEHKYRIDDVASLVDAVGKLGGEFGKPRKQVDLYYAHPSRDFATTDEALRIRRVEDEAFITYKGPKIDARSKTRQEIEIPLAGGANRASDHARLLEALGFRAVAEVSKLRGKATLAWAGHDFEVALDDVQSLGTFVELETSADEAGLENAKAALASLAERLNLREGERRSYLELLLLDRSRRHS